MKTKLPSVTIGIPAYNESSNIVAAIDGIIRQKSIRYRLAKIIVYSDGSTDNTPRIVRQLNLEKIEVIESPRRHGKPTGVNRIFKTARTSIVVILDADVSFDHDHVLDELVRRLNVNKPELATGLAKPLSPSTHIERIAMRGVEIWDHVRALASSRLYYIDGAIRAFTYPLYSGMRFPSGSADDAFSYLYCQRNGYKTWVEKKAVVRYHLVGSLRDFYKQQIRYTQSKSIQQKWFVAELVHSAYTATNKDRLKAVMLVLQAHPLDTLLYLLFKLIIKVVNKSSHTDSANWDILVSTKKPHNLRKRIIFSNYDDPSNPHYGGGGAVAMHETAKRLAKTYDVTVITGAYPGAKNEVIDCVAYSRIGTSSFGPYIGQVIFQLLLPILAITRQYNLWIENFTPPFSTACLQLFTRQPVIGLVHMLTAEDMQRKYKLPFTLIERLGLKTYHHFIVLSATTKQSIHRYNHHAQFLVVPNGVALPKGLKPYTERDGNYLLFIGRIEVNQKGLDKLLHAYRLVKDQVSIRLKLAGSGSTGEMTKLTRLIRKLDLANDVEILGRVSGSAKHKLLSRASLVLIPSRYETFSLSALEAISYGIPIVCFDIPGMAWIDKTFAHKAKSFNHVDLAAYIIWLMQNPATRAVISNNEIRVSHLYDWDKIVSRYQNYIARII